MLSIRRLLCTVTAVGLALLASPLMAQAPPSAVSESSSQTAEGTEPDPAGISTFGQRGIWRTWAAEPYDWADIVLGASLEYSYANDFLTDGDKNQRMSTRFSLAGSPISGLEINAGFSLVTNKNTAYVPDQVQSVGDPFLGVRYGHRLTDWLALGGGVQAVFPSGNEFSELSADGISTRIVFAFDLTPVPELLIGLNVGYHFDNSSRIFSHELNDAQRFAAGVNPYDQVLMSLGLAYQLGPVAPFLEYASTPAIGDNAPGFADNPSWITIGLRAWPLGLHNLHLMVAADIGLTGVSDGPVAAARTPRWNLLLAAGFNFGALPPPKVEVREVVVEKRVEVPVPTKVEVEKKGPTGHIEGSVVDAKTKKPLGGVRVTVSGKGAGIFLTDPERGTFATCPSAPGPAKLDVSLEGYREESVPVLVKDAPQTPVTVELTRATGMTFGTLRGTVRSASGKPLPALVAIPARNVRTRAAKGTGKFEHKLQTGVFDVLISMPRYVTQRRKIKLRPGDLVILNVELAPKK